MRTLFLMLAMVWTTMWSTAAAAAPEWTTSSHPAGPAWTWNRDPQLKVVIVPPAAPAPWGRGLYVVYAGTVQGIWDPVGFGSGPTWLPLLGIIPPTDGRPLVAPSTEFDLVLNAQGSGENGCDALGMDRAQVRVHPTFRAGHIDIHVILDGVAYWFMPNTGTGTVVKLAGPVTVDHASFAALTGPPVYHDDLTAYAARDTHLGSMVLDAVTPLPTLQLDPHGRTWFELDMDHACMAPYTLTAKPRTILRSTIRRRWWAVCNAEETVCLAPEDVDETGDPR